ncbi:MAG TPA: hypothetical protein VK797_23150 [Tepidisphaeraceae bacterium]|jgi:hypothetical protein|nr:hypothetical protein [Tepidisphaeraceae bacterium]
MTKRKSKSASDALSGVHIFLEGLDKIAPSDLRAAMVTAILRARALQKETPVAEKELLQLLDLLHIELFRFRQFAAFLKGRIAPGLQFGEFTWVENIDPTKQGARRKKR